MSIAKGLIKQCRLVSSIIFYCLALIVLAGCLYMRMSEKQTFFSYRFYHVVSESMTPKLPLGGLIIVNIKDSNSLEVGNIISFQPVGETTVVTHRIQAITPKGLQTKGDANNQPDNILVEPEWVIGKVTFVVPKLGRILAISQTRKGTVALICGIVWLFLFELFIKIALPPKKESQVLLEKN